MIRPQRVQQESAKSEDEFVGTQIAGSSRRRGRWFSFLGCEELSTMAKVFMAEWALHIRRAAAGLIDAVGFSLQGPETTNFAEFL